MKKLLVMLLALCMVLSVALVACENPETPAETTDAETNAPETTPAPETTQPETTQPETTQPETTQPPETTTEEVTEPTPDPVTACIAFDELAMILGDTATQFFTPGASATWDKIAIVEDYNVQYIRVFGWVGFYGEEIGEFGYQIGDDEPVYGDFLHETEDLVYQVAANEGAKNASRFQIMIPVEYLCGEGIVVKALVRDAVGTVETITEFALTKPVNPNAPVAFIPAADMAATIPGSPGITSATMSADNTYITLDTMASGDPYYQLPMLNGKGLIATHVAIKYRTSATNAAKSEMFVGSGGGPSGAGDNIQFEIVCDGKWQLAIVDLSQATAVVDGVVNYLRWDPFAGVAADATIDMAYIALFNSAEAAVAYDAKYKGVLIDTLNVPTSAWTVTGHREGVQDATDPMVAAGGVEAGALLHQGYIALGDINLAEMSKVVIYFGVDGSQVTIDAHAANAQNRIILTSADQAMTMSPTEDVVIAAADYTELGWAVHAIEIDLTNVYYNGPVYVTYDTLPGTFMLFSSVEFTYDPDYVEKPEFGSEELPLNVSETLYAVADLEEGAATENQYYTTGVVTEIGEGGSYYKNVYITDGNKTMLIYTLNPMEGMPELKVGDTITVYGYIKNYNGTIEFASKKVDDTSVYVYVVAHEPAPVQEPAAPAIVDKATAGMIGESCDTILQNDQLYFGADGQAYEKLAAVDNTITIKAGDTLAVRGWIGFPQAIKQFGLSVNGGDMISVPEFTQPAEDAVIQLAGEHASRYHIALSTAGVPAGTYSVSWGAQLADGTIVVFYTVTVILEAAE